MNIVLVILAALLLATNVITCASSMNICSALLQLQTYTTDMLKAWPIHAVRLYLIGELNG